jgi:hypothetical protein
MKIEQKQRAKHEGLRPFFRQREQASFSVFDEYERQILRYSDVGRVIGSSIAYHLLSDGFDGTVAILEKDPSYEFASTPLSEGGFRQQFIQEVKRLLPGVPVGFSLAGQGMLGG